MGGTAEGDKPPDNSEDVEVLMDLLISEISDWKAFREALDRKDIDLTNPEKAKCDLHAFIGRIIQHEEELEIDNGLRNKLVQLLRRKQG